MPTFPVINAMRTTMFYHLGSVAFGSFIIAIVQFIRVVLEYINRKTQQIQQNNQVGAAAVCGTTACTLVPVSCIHAPHSTPNTPTHPPKAMHCLRCCLRAAPRLAPDTTHWFPH